MSIRETRFSGLSEQLDWLFWKYHDTGKLSNAQLSQLKECAETIACFGELGNEYYKEAKIIVTKLNRKAMRIRRKVKNECECFYVGNKIVCFTVDRFLYLGTPSQNKNTTPDDYKTIKAARKAAIEMCEDYLKGMALGNCCGEM